MTNIYLTIKKILDWLLEAFIVLYDIFLYSLILPLTLGAILIFIVPIANWLSDLFWMIKFPIFIAVGISLKYLRNNYLQKKRKQL